MWTQLNSNPSNSRFGFVSQNVFSVLVLNQKTSHKLVQAYKDAFVSEKYVLLT